MLRKSLTVVSLAFALTGVGCAHHKMKNMSAEDHERMGKAHGDTAACLKQGKSKDECGQIMKEAMGCGCGKKK